jgi:hypothetical protein
MEVRIKSTQANNWSGIQRYPGCNDTIGPYLTRSGSVYTGLKRDDEKRLGEALGYDLRKSSKFWETFRIKIGTEDVVLDLEDPADELKYLFLKGHKRVKGTVTEFKATADYYIYNPEEEAEIFNNLGRVKRQAIREFDKLKPAEIKKALRLYGYSANNMSDSVAEDKLFKLVEQNPQHFIDKWVNNTHKATEYLIKEALAKNVIRKTKNIHSYGTITLGNSLEDTISFIDNGENSDIKASIINEADLKL